jgi:hypothetical protein
MTTQFQGALIKEQGQQFAVVIVQPPVIQNADKTEANRLIAAFELNVFRVPVVLMAQDHHGVPTYYGRQDLSSFLAALPLQSIPWKEFTLTE